MPDFATAITYKWQPVYDMDFLFPLKNRSRKLLAWAVSCSPNLDYLTHHCSSILKSVCSLLCNSCSYIPVLFLMSLKSCSLGFSMFPFSTSLLLLCPLSFSLFFPSLHSHCEVTDPRCCWEAELDGPLSAHPQHLLQVRVTALQLFDYAPVSALKGLSSLATYLASNGNLINASVFKHHNFSKKVYSAFQIVYKQTFGTQLLCRLRTSCNIVKLQQKAFCYRTIILMYFGPTWILL